MTENYSRATAVRSDMTESVVPLGESTSVECNSNAFSVESKTAPEVLVTPIEGLTDPFTHDEGTAAMQSIETRPHDLAEPALNTLREISRGQEAYRIQRLRNMRLARTCGVSNRQIGEALGVTEAAARLMLKRADAQ